METFPHTTDGQDQTYKQVAGVLIELAKELNLFIYNPDQGSEVSPMHISLDPKIYISTPLGDEILNDKVEQFMDNVFVFFDFFKNYVISQQGRTNNFFNEGSTESLKNSLIVDADSFIGTVIGTVPIAPEEKVSLYVLLYAFIDMIITLRNAGIEPVFGSPTIKSIDIHYFWRDFLGSNRSYGNTVESFLCGINISTSERRHTEHEYKGILFFMAMIGNGIEMFNEVYRHKKASNYKYENRSQPTEEGIEEFNSWHEVFELLSNISLNRNEKIGVKRFLKILDNIISMENTSFDDSDRQAFSIYVVHDLNSFLVRGIREIIDEGEPSKNLVQYQLPSIDTVEKIANQIVEIYKKIREFGLIYADESFDDKSLNDLLVDLFESLNDTFRRNNLKPRILYLNVIAEYFLSFLNDRLVEDLVHLNSISDQDRIQKEYTPLKIMMEFGTAILKESFQTVANFRTEIETAINNGDIHSMLDILLKELTVYDIFKKNENDVSLFYLIMFDFVADYFKNEIETNTVKKEKEKEKKKIGTMLQALTFIQKLIEIDDINYRDNGKTLNYANMLIRKEITSFLQYLKSHLTEDSFVYALIEVILDNKFLK